ncbi:sodium/potassium/calcium exchanger 3-like [Uranotaenia lowii]|uniref:sodium/potassium/calcium exchanger 3-like n=1 Tax=Uranotaenia lowii TaxID=190385 RepID=UPI00247A61DF|nr:sodium/potassium/calcium exchanger 3-like [Uranotaenia lowii]XP_055601045.1 sodium/potassium/calcium exchanger 3-like [Uranotaenia lowii]XP_055601046.1 sodium/potassium/calcium exchanger 3-like [Uranotaenia lowii]XP_055601047.1 sodium/potassium/calcium exchanger 3-like [Uranotaenia lowii]XP_055601048.1 sodium/potassium/calcium exchanger 3-like [Uranotaenia lowii]XP_055601049.1 sodium/potassium/calcium exchanger 3-like [Uranotaenia lowii]
MVESRTFCGIKHPRVKIAFVLRVLFFLSLVSISLLNSVISNSDGRGSVVSRARPRRHLLEVLQDQVEVFDVATGGAEVFDLTTSTTLSPDVTTAFNESDVGRGRNCTPPAIYEFPSDGFTRYQRRHGWIAVHILIACYCFWLLAIVCDDYFVPVIELLCKKLQVKEDVAGATFMAAASSSPELFINCVGTFVTKGDIGVGAVVGSAVFNILAVPAVCGLFGGQVVQLRWWPVTRDSIMYGMAVIGLITVLIDGKVVWYEALVLVSAYVFYISAMYCNDSINRFMSRTLRRKSNVRPYTEVTEISPLLKNGSNGSQKANGENGHNGHMCDSEASEDSFEEDELASTPWDRRDENTFAYICRWPVTFALWATIPDCRRYPKLRILTFFSCIFWIGITSYFVAFLITVVGDTIDIPDSVMGLTFLAAGTSVPEAVSSIIITNRGHGEMGISNSIGSNTFDILLCLGLPWLIKSLGFPAVPGERWVVLNSQGLTYSAISLLSTLCGLYLAFWTNRFKLDWKVGLTCTSMYVAFLTVSSLIELNVFFPVNLPTCEH